MELEIRNGRRDAKQQTNARLALLAERRVQMIIDRELASKSRGLGLGSLVGPGEGYVFRTWSSTSLWRRFGFNAVLLVELLYPGLNVARIIGAQPLK
ncbi:hypothetical protein WN72_05390 [Bradyrhizobium arachidis]|uniref:Uncharacterized protein n=1 Tax=Bradyrhizobium arachidis TaxID=858423 RepID=A0AAE7NJ14_9BRAD|nr:hypothetical protein WN72_05390 [Bradyrhizobium arachidis]